MRSTQTFMLSAIMALATMAFAAPTTKPAPFHLPATYGTGGPGSMTIHFNDDGTFATSRALPPSICDNKPVCPELGGKGMWSYAADSRQITLVQKISADWTVTQVWQKGAESRDALTTTMTGNKIVKAEGKDSDKYPLPKDAADWERAEGDHDKKKDDGKKKDDKKDDDSKKDSKKKRKCHPVYKEKKKDEQTQEYKKGDEYKQKQEDQHYGKRPPFPTPAPAPMPAKPFTLPATYITGGPGGVVIAIKEDGTFATTRAVAPSVCEGRDVCPERGMKGAWTWNQEKLQLTLKAAVAADWTTEQVWELKGMSRDANTSQITGAHLVSSKGKDATQYPIAEGVKNWTRN